MVNLYAKPESPDPPLMRPLVTVPAESWIQGERLEGSKLGLS